MTDEENRGLRAGFQRRQRHAGDDQAQETTTVHGQPLEIGLQSTLAATSTGVRRPVRLHALVRLENREPATLATIRRIILGLAAFGTLGMTVELLLVGHYEDANQLIPLVVAGLGLVAFLWTAVSPTVAALRLLQFAMLLYAGSAVIGVTLHYKANVALQHETRP